MTRLFNQAARAAATGLLLGCALLPSTGCSQLQDQAAEAAPEASEGENAPVAEPAEPVSPPSSNPVPEGEEETAVVVTVEGVEYAARLNGTRTAEDILGMMPLALSMQRFAEHEYYAELPARPSIEGVPATSRIEAGGIYYWEGWNAFVFNYIDSDIAPYGVVQVGTFDEGLNDYLLSSAPDVVELSVSEDPA